MYVSLIHGARPFPVLVLCPGYQYMYICMCVCVCVCILAFIFTFQLGVMNQSAWVGHNSVVDLLLHVMQHQPQLKLI